MTINYPFDSMQHGTILGTVHKFSPGGEAIIVLSDEGNGNEVVFEEAEARAVYAWLGRALSTALETRECDHDFTFTENKDSGWCTRCRVEYDYTKHGQV